MMKTWQRRTIGVLTLGGSGAGFVLVLDKLFNSQFGVAALVILIAALVIYGVGMAAGVQILESSKNLKILALPFWALQVPVISSPWISYELSSGARFNVLISGDGNLAFTWAAGSQFSFYVFQGVPVSLGANIVAIIVVYMIAKYGGAGRSPDQA